jgi:HTH-type transcriptional regulator / antitoxin HigA
VRDAGFLPRWASPPGDTIKAVMVARDLTMDDLSRILGFSGERLAALLAGQEPITIEVARRLRDAIGGSIEFWITRDGQYRADVQNVAADVWAQSLPVEDMVNFGWIDRPGTWVQQIDQALGFFGVPTVESWHVQYGAAVQAAKFRFTGNSRLDPSAVATWLRRAELEARDVALGTWDPRLFLAALPAIRQLTRVDDPRAFVPALRDEVAKAGVAVAVVRAPRGCKASGAARLLVDGHPQIVLSARYLTDDHFWFTFFHEAGHLLRHDNRTTFVDEFELEAEKATGGEEVEANRFAGEFLLPESVRGALLERGPSIWSIGRAAKAAGVSPGVVVGQLQHLGRLGFGSGYNKLKRRYRWSGTRLETA